MEQKRRRGRPALEPVGQRSTLTIRIRIEVRRDVERAAILNGRSLSEEIEHRLERRLELGKVEERIARLEVYAAGGFLSAVS